MEIQGEKRGAREGEVQGVCLNCGDLRLRSLPEVLLAKVVECAPQRVVAIGVATQRHMHKRAPEVVASTAVVVEALVRVLQGAFLARKAREETQRERKKQLGIRIRQQALTSPRGHFPVSQLLHCCSAG